MNKVKKLKIKQFINMLIVAIFVYISTMPGAQALDKKTTVSVAFKEELKKISSSEHFEDSPPVSTDFLSATRFNYLKSVTNFRSKSPITINVPAQTQWFDTGIDIKRNQRLTIMAGGQWTNGGVSPKFVGPSGWSDVHFPNSLAPNLPFASLIGKISDNTFFVGSNYQGRSNAEGRIFLSINDLANSFSDNGGFLKVMIVVKMPITSEIGSKRTSPSNFIPAEELKGFVKFALIDTRVQLSQTGAGSPLQIESNSGISKSFTSYIAFGPALKGWGVKDIPIELPKNEYTPDQFVGGTGASTLAQYFVTHSVVFVDKIRFQINNINTNLSNDLEVRLAPGEINLDISLHAPNPAIRGEGNGFTAVPFGIPIPLGWKDELCPDITMNDLRAIIHLVPSLDSSGKMFLKDPIVELTGSLSLTIGDPLVKEMKSGMLKSFQNQLARYLASPEAKQAIERALILLFLSGKPNENISLINIDEGGTEVFFKK